MFKSLADIDDQFKSENDCVNHLERMRWGDSPACVACGSLHPYKLSVGKNYKCSSCGKFFNVLSGTLLENTKIPLVKWFKAIYLFTSHKKGVSSIQLGKDLSITQKSAWFMLSRLRELLRDKKPVMLSGSVQMDCTVVGGKMKNKSKSKREALRLSGAKQNSDKTIVLSMIENGQTVHNTVISAEESKYILPVVTSLVSSDSVVVSDEGQAFKGLAKHYDHVTVNHSQDQYVNKGFTTNGVEGFYSQLKRGIYGIYHHASKEHLFRYCGEFAFRYNTRSMKEAERFNHALGLTEGTRLRYSTLIGKDTKK